MAIGNTWTSVSSGRLLTAGQAWIDSRVQWRRPSANRFEFRLQLNVNQALVASTLTISWRAGGHTVQATHATNISAGSGWVTVGGNNGVWVRTAAQVGSEHQIVNLGAQIRFATWSLIFEGRQIGNDQWWVARSNATINLAPPNQIRWNNTGVLWNNTPVLWNR